MSRVPTRLPPLGVRPLSSISPRPPSASPTADASTAAAVADGGGPPAGRLLSPPRVCGVSFCFMKSPVVCVPFSSSAFFSSSSVSSSSSTSASSSSEDSVAGTSISSTFSCCVSATLSNCIFKSWLPGNDDVRSVGSGPLLGGTERTVASTSPPVADTTTAAPHHSTQRAHTSSTRPVIIIAITPVTCVQPSAQTNSPSTQSESKEGDNSVNHAPPNPEMRVTHHKNNN
ncbi:hypothetical protein MOQ_008106 [Trypanosoma cruzi marinkellei]|uniref:Uncharacterized protein n=1 Tax=Trypanosoma cruzi marinkellei TaxID=85056 RepID=K2MLW2_TRYCR|nr:hypothetical protein MOQ_008106 [Trypanosoma cruzi marinkellei]